MKAVNKFYAVVSLVILGCMMSVSARAQRDEPLKTRDVILVHGAWADGPKKAAIQSFLPGKVGRSA